MSDPALGVVEVFVGVDIAEGDHYASALTAAGEAVLGRSVANDETSINQLIDDAATHGAVALVIDTTSSPASLLMEPAARRKVSVAYVSGLAMRRAADLYAGAAKTDPKDAAVLADYARRNADRFNWTTPSDELLARLRILNGRDTDLAADATRAANRLRDALVAVCPALERAVGDKLVTNAGLRDVLSRWGAPSALRAAGRARNPRPHRQTLAPQRRTPRRGDLVRPGRADPHRGRRGHLERNHRRPRQRPGPHLRAPRSTRRRHRGGLPGAPTGKSPPSLCGFGPRTGARTLAEIGDPHRFADGGRLAAYAALAPIDWQSGRSATTRKPRGGNHRLKNAMFTAAFVATQHDPDARAYYQRKRAEGKRHNAAVICVARRRCNIILAMLKTQTPYQPPQPQNLPKTA